MKKGENKTPFEIWYDYEPNVNYFKVFESKCYILKYARKGKLEARSDECVFLAYYIKTKAYKCLNSNNKIIIESENVRVDEYDEKNEEE